MNTNLHSHASKSIGKPSQKTRAYYNSKGTKYRIGFSKSTYGCDGILAIQYICMHTETILLCHNVVLYYCLITVFIVAHLDVHSEAVQAALERQCERKMAVPMPSKRHSLVVQTSMEAYTPPGYYDEGVCVFVCVCP